MADLVFVGCSLAEAAAPLAPAGGAAPRRPVVLGGRRVKIVDVHAHCAVPEAMALMGSTVSPQALLMVQEPVHERMRKMDAQSIDVEALSINPYWYGAERDLARQIIAIQNEKLAEYCAARRSALWPSPPWRCSIQTWQPSKLDTKSGPLDLLWPRVPMPLKSWRAFRWHICYRATGCLPG